ncbi:hypothetical protein Tco_1409224, partial [Tanacetum coccineum]
YGFIKNHMKTVKNRPARTRKSEECKRSQRFKAEARKVKPQLNPVKSSQHELGIQDHSNEQSSSKLVSKVFPKQAPNKTAHQDKRGITIPPSHSNAEDNSDTEHPSDTNVFTMKMEILLEPASNKLLVAVSTLDSGTTIMMFGASVMIVGVGIGVVVCCTDEMIGVTKGEGTTVKTGVSAIISGIGGRLVLSGITDGDWV